MTTNWNWIRGGMPDAMSGDGWTAPPVFAGQKLVVVGGSSGMGRQTAADVVAAGGSAVIIGDTADKVSDTVQELSKSGKAYGITADLSDRKAAAAGGRQVAARPRRRAPARERGRAVRAQAVPRPRRGRLRLLPGAEPGD